MESSYLLQVVTAEWLQVSGEFYIDTCTTLTINSKAHIEYKMFHISIVIAWSYLR